MRFILYTHSLVSDWNHGNAHFLRGILSELTARGHTTLALEPEGGWSRSNLLAEQGDAPLARFAAEFPALNVMTYDDNFDHEAATEDADVVIVHEWTKPHLVEKLGKLRRLGARYTLLFHDTHHRGVSNGDSIAQLPLEDYDAVLAFGEALRAQYLRHGWGRRVFTWHEAADTRVFYPREPEETKADLVWIGNWGDGERSREIEQYLIEPAETLNLSGHVHGVRYPAEALAMLNATRLLYGGWIANADVPAAFARHSMTVHIPRRPYVAALPGIPTIRVFEALACGIPLVCAPWDDSENLFRPGKDFLSARDGDEMVRHLNALRHDTALAANLKASGLERIRARHSCTHRVDELLKILVECGKNSSSAAKAEAVP